MPKGVPNKRYTPGFKRMVVETMKKEHLSIYAAMQEFGINDHTRTEAEIYSICDPFHELYISKLEKAAMERCFRELKLDYAEDIGMTGSSDIGNADYRCPEYSAPDCAPRPLKLSIRSGGIEHPCRRR